jgi:nicotinamidase-related amidase
MKNILVYTIGLILLNICLIAISEKTIAQERYLIVLDIQEFHKKPQLDSSVKEMVVNVNSIISHFDSEKVIYVQARGKALNITSKGFEVDTLPAPAFDSSLKVVSNNIFTKIEGDAFTAIELTNFLESKKVKEIVLVGLMADKCIYNTAIGGQLKGYDITIVPEGIVGTSPKKKEKAIIKMKDKGIKFIPITEIINTK